MTAKPDNVSADGRRLIEQWFSAQTEVERCKERLRTAETDEANATLAVGKWLLPSDARAGEKIAVWFGDSLIQAEVRHQRDPLITIRKRGESIDRARMSHA